MISFIYLAGGKGKRFGSDIPKQFLSVAGKPIFIHSLERINLISEISEIVIVCSDKYRNMITEILTQYGINKSVVFADGGTTRQESVYNGLKKAKHDVTVIHESARPFVKKSEFENIINSEHKNVTYGIKIPFTVVTGDKKVESVLDREQLTNIQLPQKFEKHKLLAAHEKAILESKVYTDDSTLFLSYQHENVYIIEGTEYNTKITKHMDLIIGEIIYKQYILGDI